MESLKSQLAILLILILIFFCQKLSRILESTVDGEIPIDLVFSLLGLGMFETIQLILPLSLFLSLLMTISRLHEKNEITVMHACGLKKFVLIQIAMILAFLTGITSAVSVMWTLPWFSYYQNRIMTESKVRLGMLTLTSGQFQRIDNGNSVLFIKNIDDSGFHDVFFAQINPKKNTRSSIIIAESGKLLNHKDGSQIIILNNGTRFEGINMMKDFFITNFQNYQEIIKNQIALSDHEIIEQMNIFMLWNANTDSAKAELHWRITLVYTVFIMALIAVPLSTMNPYHRQWLSILTAMLLYLVYFLLQTFIKSNAAKGKVDPIFWTWTINGVYFFLSVILNLKDSVYIRRIQIFLRTKD